MEEAKIQQNKSLLEKLAPIVLVIGVIILGYFIFSKIKIGSPDVAVNQMGDTQTVQVEVDTEFLMSGAFTALKFIPDSAIFNDVTGNVPAGRDDPFAPVK